MTTPNVPNRLPAPTAAAALIAALLGTFAAWNLLVAITAPTPRTEVVALYVGLVAVLGYVAVGTLRGWIAAQAFGVVAGLGITGVGVYVATASDLAIRLLGYDRLGLVAIAVGVALVGLLVVPQSSRDWFNYKR